MSTNDEKIDPGTGELIVMPTMALAVARPPKVVLEEARQAAVALMEVIKAKPKPVIMNGETYLEFEDWQTVARFYGVSARVVETKYVTLGGAAGYECKAEAIDNNTGKIVSAAEAMCLNDEEKWRARPKYTYLYVCKDGTLSVDDPGKDQIIWETSKDGKKHYPKKERKLTGEEAVPMYQLRSMAQTRACAKALRNILAWVVVLAGFKTTPAEEMEGVFPDKKKDAPHLDPNALATDKQKGVIEKFISKRTTADQEWWLSVFPETLTQERAGKMIKWLGSNSPDTPLPFDEWNAMLSGAADGK
jgi:hypothetical protein